jgi:hypothetical protein
LTLLRLEMNMHLVVSRHGESLTAASWLSRLHARDCDLQLRRLALLVEHLMG